ncbi:CehA/McbA family metallohydrolase [Litorilinea aerophila]|uniref:CehA/McbA family metallohydrolase n=1 Tax=Litorilinea aerophila TaxID=1204385 RepID=UPI001B885955|nr:CehA/McbA family metallohydrolase [Litorilinea aerophila]MCC9077752.1 CehA/McbA family metallohydrolase [Litorilinea aerophila]
MSTPPSPHFSPVNLAGLWNQDRRHLDATLRPPQDYANRHGLQNILGIPFELGPADSPNVILLDQEPVTIPLDGARASYILFLHAVEDRVTCYQQGLADYATDGNELGTQVAQYTLEYADGQAAATPILRRFAIQQSRIQWGASPFAAMPAQKPEVFLTTTDEQILGRVPRQPYGRGETRHISGREVRPEHLWVYALPNPHPERPIRQLVLSPGEERAVIYAISITQLQEHPLRPGVRRKLRLTLPEGVEVNRLGELEGVDIDLGTVISARAALDYDADRWQGEEPVVQPRRSDREVLVEYAAHPHARLYLTTGPDSHLAVDLATLDHPAVVEVKPAHRPVTVRVVARESGQPVAVRLHMHGEAGEYLPPRGHHRKVNGYWFEDNYAEFVNLYNQYSYIDGHCVVDLPLGWVYVEITRGYEVRPIRTRVEVKPETEELVFELDKVLRWREQGWVTADTHVHFLSPQTALLEGQAEGVNVVNLLASQWGEMFSNVGDFDGKTTFGAREFGGDGEFLVRVGTENRMQVLGHISLLGYAGAMIHPLCTGGPTESAIGDPLEVTMAEWAERCIAQGGLVVMPHAPNPQLERAADFVLGVVHATEMMTFNPLSPNNIQVNPYGLADWYRYLNLGYQIPVVGGSDKMAASSLLGGIRTYAHLGEREFTYENWMAAVRDGNTFVTVGPLAAITVEGVSPGGQVHLPAGGGTVQVTWRVESVSLPIEQVEVVVGGLTAEQVHVGKALDASGSVALPIRESTWIALRVRGSYKGQAGEIAAHTSAVQVLVDGKPLFSPTDAAAVLDQIEGAIAYVDTLAPRPEAQRFRQLRARLEAAYNRLHQRMHQQGIFHRHTPLHQHDRPHEH